MGVNTPSDYLFCSRDSLTQPISESTMNNALKNLGYRGRQSPHGFRHIASTALNEEFPHLDQVIESALAHKKRGVKADYDKSTHLENRVYLMQWWADHINYMISEIELVR